MLGNDVVDLALARNQSNWRRPNYLTKIFSANEQKLVYEAENPDVVVWLLWSMKEAAYKVVNRKTGQRLYNPLAFACAFNLGKNHCHGTVRFGDECFATESSITSEAVHTLCVQKDISFKDVRIVFGANRPDYRQVFNENHNHLRLAKNADRLPEIYDLISNVRHPASVSHHGRYLWLAYPSQMGTNL
ncbi:4'-phosphopantetheinyl transferase family protein [Pedobacter endophyticus]|uniref:4-phosphopantetheinyl transferase family protein n=1 Tax=Pedobacter endophyticus TaxID=2789740 RepID=A0A7S9KZ62_9SPHI|nr:4'-phosphopantetheinyl transferase superfamily protein [Pedobacter endophyticus]QPH39538.1 4-phosphopantetheinyl transferase family protein [Pedobacter endophyticus]